ncbi:MAG: peptidyl-prolyl cis-trans isomerase [Candidatus Omnitrophica bacterium]|nr:peptidyl-prolyl cis-trans isomerase [Candidatus Omnitrophota bacterium]
MIAVAAGLAGCSKSGTEAKPAKPGAAAGASAASARAAQQASATPLARRSDQIAGEIFGVPVSMDNYLFAKRVAYMFPQPWGAADLPEADRERNVWDNLIFHYQSFRQGITVTEEELESLIDELLKGQQKSFTRRGDSAAYHAWLKDSLQEDVELFENQIRYLIQIRKLKDSFRAEEQVTVTDDELTEEFLNEHHHVGGEMVVFDDRPPAQAFYEQVKEPGRWDAVKAKGDVKIRPVSLMTLEAYMDLWEIPKDQIYAFHAMEIGSVGPPMPFGKQWCVYRLLEKRDADLKDFPAQRDSYVKQVESKKKYEGLKRRIEELKRSARLRVLSSPGAVVVSR